MHRIARGLVRGLLSVAALGVAMPAFSEPFPNRKPVEMTVMFGAGSAADVTARYLADGMAKNLGVPVPVVNRTGGGGAIGYNHVKKQKPDGYSIIWNSNSISTNYHSGILQFDYTAFDPVARVSVETPVIAVRADAPWKTLKEMVEYAKANPDKVRIGNSGAGSHTHFSSSALFLSGGAKVVDVPFGEGQAVVNLLGSRVEGIVQLPAAVVAHVKSGDLRVLAVLGAKRDPILPTFRPPRSSAIRSRSICGAALRCSKACRIRSSRGSRTRSNAPSSPPRSRMPAKRSDSCRRTCRRTISAS